MKKVVYILSLLVGVLLVACGDIANEPIIQGEKTKTYDYRAQEHILRVVTVGNRSRYNHRSNWWFTGVRQGDSTLTSRVDTLPNGDICISADWLSCIIPRDKETILISLKENESYHQRELRFLSNSDKGFGPNFTIVQTGKPR